MKTFKEHLEENRKLAVVAASLIPAVAMAAPPKPEATDYIVGKMKEKEGFRPVAEPDKDAKGNPVVVGYGTTHIYPDTRKPIKVGETITPEKAEQLIRASIEKDITPKMEKIPGWDEMDSGKQSALLSFGYNVGQNFYGSKGFETITNVLKNKEWDKVPSALNLYNKAGGKVLRGLVTRRAEEGKLWTSGISKPTTPEPQKPKSQPQPTQPQTQPAPDANQYTVGKGDNLTNIAKKHGKTIQDILKLNPDIKDPNKINPGQKIKTK